jgi:hypothetical protein
MHVAISNPDVLIVLKAYFESICLKTATNADLKKSLYHLSYFLRQKFGRKVVRDVLPALLKVIVMNSIAEHIVINLFSRMNM